MKIMGLSSFIKLPTNPLKNELGDISENNQFYVDMVEKSLWIQCEPAAISHGGRISWDLIGDRVRELRSIW